MKFYAELSILILKEKIIKSSSQKLMIKIGFLLGCCYKGGEPTSYSILVNIISYYFVNQTKVLLDPIDMIKHTIKHTMEKLTTLCQNKQQQWL